MSIIPIAWLLICLVRRAEYLGRAEFRVSIGVNVLVFVLVQLWFITIRCRWINFEAGFSLLVIALTPLSYFATLFRVCRLTGADPVQFGAFGTEGDDSIPLLLYIYIFIYEYIIYRCAYGIVPLLAG